MMKQKRRLVVKFGSKTVVDCEGRINAKVMGECLKEVAKLREDYSIVIVSSGAVRLGRQIPSLIMHKVSNWKDLPYGKDILAEQLQAGNGWPKLMSYFLGVFEHMGIDCAQILATGVDFRDRYRYLGLRSVTENYLEAGIIPVFNENDVLAPVRHSGDIDDNDQLAAMTAAMVGAIKLIVLSDVDGFIDGPISNPNSRVVPVIVNPDEYEGMIDDSASEGKGGMLSKLHTASLVMKLGIDMHLVNGSTQNVLTRIMAGEKLGSYFPAATEKPKAIKAWLATAPAGPGKIIASTTLAEVLRDKRIASVLITGIDQIEGRFEKGEIISVYDDRGQRLGKGQVRYSSEELNRRVEEYRQDKAKEIADTGRKGDEAIHYDYFVFD